MLSALPHRGPIPLDMTAMLKQLRESGQATAAAQLPSKYPTTASALTNAASGIR